LLVKSYFDLTNLGSGAGTSNKNVCVFIRQRGIASQRRPNQLLRLIKSRAARVQKGHCQGNNFVSQFRPLILSEISMFYT
jgi:hypothetical protein